jgi:putative transposase
MKPVLGPPASSPASSRASPGPGFDWRSRGYLPHRDAVTLVQHVVFGLADSIPADQRIPSAMHADRLLDENYGACLLRDARCAEIVQRALLHSDGTRHRLMAWCIMPNHVHVVVEQIAGFALGDIVQVWKSTSAHRINHLLGRRGRLWRREYFDRFMRDEDHLTTTIQYVEANPVEAKLVTNAALWPWSSAGLKDAGGDAGGPR